MSGGGTGKRASTRGGGAGKRAATAGGGTGRRAPARADSVLELDDDQVVEIAEVSEPRMLVGPVVHVVCHEASAGQLGALRGVVASLGLRLLAEASGADLGLALAALRGEPAPDVVIAALPTGEPLVRAALALAPGRPVVVVTAAGELRGAIASAHSVGADLVMMRPHQADQAGPVLLAAAELARTRIRLLTAEGTQAVLRSRLDGLTRSDQDTGLSSFELFQKVLELELRRARRYGYPLSVALVELVIGGGLPPAHERILRVRAAAGVTSAVRDIDLPTELGDGRLLVLLPYTDVTGAAAVARRMIAACAGQPAVVLDGVAHPPQVRVAIAGGGGGGPLSFAQLMKAAAAALATVGPGQVAEAP